MIRVPVTEAVFNDLIDRLAQASSPAARQASFDQWFQPLERQRIERNEASFPPQVQQRIDNFDRTTPIIPVTEAEEIKRAYHDCQQNRKQSSQILQEHNDKLVQIYCELRSHVWNSQMDLPARERIFEHLNRILALLVFSQYYTNQFTLSDLRIDIRDLQNHPDFNRFEALLQNSKMNYPVPHLRPALNELDNDLEQIKFIIQGSWYKRFWNVLNTVVCFMTARLLGMALLGTGGLVGLLAWFGTDMISRRRDWYKHDSYQNLKDNQTPVTPEQQASAEVGFLAAGSVSKQFTSMFNLAAWKNPRQYYGAMAARQLDDQPTLDRMRGIRV